MDGIAISYPFAFLAGLVSFLSPCVLPVVPAYLTFVSGLTLEQLAGGEGDAGQARRTAALHAALFAAGFMAVFMTLGASATALGQTFNRALPVVARVGGIVVIAFGLVLLGVVRVPTLAREVRLHLTEKPTGAVGSVLVGVVFGAGWTPCIGPILATILFYASAEATAARGMALLGVYGLGLAVPFLAAAVGFNWFLAGARRLRPFLPALQRAAGILLVAAGVLLLTGRFAAVSTSLADLGQWIDLEMP
ncbi:MAG: cytochrome c biogenesis protein CcdA [Gemmatimonadetes bacterium]|nr:MAG: cytochrome c biogenesis protein CcdA [Gemmatimonadota bacterium]